MQTQCGLDLKTAPYDIRWSEVARFAKSRTPEGWRPTFDDRPLGKRAPVDWARGHYTSHPGRFEPAKACANIVRLVNHARKNPEDRRSCWKMADEYVALAVRASIKHGDARFIARPYEHRGNASGWVNSLSNAFMLTALAHMQTRRPREEVGQLMDELANAFLLVNTPTRKLERPWFVWWDRGFLWFDEYPMDDSRPTLVLNGHIHSLYGLMAYHVVSPQDWTEAYVQAGLYTMRRYARQFRNPNRINFYAIHDQSRDYAPARTVRQQRELGRITGDPFFDAMADKFERDYLKDRRLAKVVADNLAAKRDLVRTSTDAVSAKVSGEGRARKPEEGTASRPAR